MGSHMLQSDGIHYFGSLDWYVLGPIRILFFWVGQSMNEGPEYIYISLYISILREFKTGPYGVSRAPRFGPCGQQMCHWRLFV